MAGSARGRRSGTSNSTRRSWRTRWGSTSFFTQCPTDTLESDAMTVESSRYEVEKQVVEQIREARKRIGQELSKAVVGQAEVTELLLFSLFSGGHCLITGAPGLAKTLLVRSLAQVFHLKFQRIQFTPDLMPTDITGTEILEDGADGRRRMQFVK